VIEVELAGGVIARFSERRDGDLRPSSPEAADEARARLAPLPWTLPRQVHSAQVLVVERAQQGIQVCADSVVTAERGLTIGVLVADCAPVVLAAEGAVGVVHAGWRGLAAGVVDVAVEVFRAITTAMPVALVGPCAGPECYEFGDDMLDELEKFTGLRLRGRTSWGARSLDLPGGVESALRRCGVTDVQRVGDCTICGERWYSHRRGDVERQGLLAWRL